MKISLNLCIKRSTSPIKSVISTLYGRSSALLQSSSMMALDSVNNLICSLGRKVYKWHCGENAKKYLVLCFSSSIKSFFPEKKTFVFLVFQKLLFTRWTCFKKNFSASISCVFLTYIHPVLLKHWLTECSYSYKGKKKWLFNVTFISQILKILKFSPRECCHFLNTMNTVSSVWLWLFCFLIPHSIYNNTL